MIIELVRVQGKTVVARGIVVQFHNIRQVAARSRPAGYAFTPGFAYVLPCFFRVDAAQDILLCARKRYYGGFGDKDGRGRGPAVRKGSLCYSRIDFYADCTGVFRAP